jgi:hypothetical protein
MAPGNDGWALCSTNIERFTGCLNGRGQPSPIQDFGGTSQAAPFVAGAAALVIEAYAAAHGGARPSPALVKRILTGTAADQNDPADRQGAGLLDCRQAVLAALSRGHNLIVDRTQLAATAAPGSAQRLALTVTNTGAQTQTVTARTRVLDRVVFDRTGSVTLDATAPGAPTWTDGFGTRRAFVTRPFTVAPGTDHLDTAIAFSPSDQPVRVRLLDPGGGLVGESSFEHPSGFGHVDVHAPVAGTWTAVFDAAARPDGFNGTIFFQFHGSAYTPLGTVSPASLTLRPGQSGTFTIAVATPAQPGDRTATIQLDTAGRRLAVPLTLRSLVRPGRFSGTLTGGNGRDGAPAQVTFYRFDVPAGLRDFAINLTFHGDPNQLVFGFLAAPDGQVLSQQANATVDPDGNVVFGPSLQEFRRDPRPGRWTFAVQVSNPVAGTATSVPFTGQLRFNAVDVRASGVPSSPATVLPTGQPATAQVTVHNTGITTNSFFVDPRSTALTDLRVRTEVPETGVPVPTPDPLFYVVPTECVRLTATATATAPIDLEMLAVTGEPRVQDRFDGRRPAVATVRAAQVTPGPWLVGAVRVGPFPPGGVPPATADFSLTARGQAFDRAVTSSTGDAWLRTVQAEPPPFTPLVLAPGATGTITVTITPAAPRGTVVSGVLYVDDFSEFAETGDELRAIPYAYTVG